MDMLNTTNLAWPPFDAAHTAKLRTNTKMQRPTSPFDLNITRFDDPGGPVNIIEELGSNYSLYYVEKKPGAYWVNVTSLPSTMRTTLDKLKAKVTRIRTPGIHPTLCCCMFHGSPLIEANEHVKELVAMKRHFDELEQEGSHREEFVSQYFRSPLDVSIEAGKRQNVAVPEELKKRISGLSLNTGVTESSLAILSAMAILATQSEVPANYRKQFSEKVEQFFSLVEMKVVGAMALVDAL